MAIISIFNGIFCKEKHLTNLLIQKTGYKHLQDADVVSKASALSGISANKIEKIFSTRTSLFNKFTHESERSLAYLKLALAEILLEKDIIIEGFTTQLIPKEITHVLSVCIIADIKFRLSVAEKEEGLGESEAVKLILKKDEESALWVNMLHKIHDPWNLSLYDIIIPSNKMNEEESIDLIIENMGKNVLKISEVSEEALNDFKLSAQIEVALSKQGHIVDVSAQNGNVTLTVKKHVLMLNRLKEELKAIVSVIEGVKNVEIKLGPDFYKTDIYRKHEFKMPTKILLVDDEREFVKTLSERLLIREMDSAVTYDGESALELIKEDEPEVMILDLRMPGIGGIEVLKRVKATNPDIEVIILTGHGSEADRQKCIDLGAFAYFQKPVDIDELSKTIKKANEQIYLKQKNNTK